MFSAWRAVYDKLTESLTELQRIESGCSMDEELRGDIEVLLEPLLDSILRMPYKENARSKSFLCDIRNRKSKKENNTKKGLLKGLFCNKTKL